MHEHRAIYFVSIPSFKRHLSAIETRSVAMSTQSTMRTLVIEIPNSPFRLTEIPLPAPGPGEVLVRVKASGVNPLDTKIRAGAAGHARHPLPAILGIDLAGVVEAVGPDVSGFGRGDEVYGMTGGVGGIQGSLAEYAAVDADLLALKPHNLSMREAAALPLVFITAWEGLVDRANVRSGQKVLVLGAGGGVGHIAVQIARSFGADVYAVDGAAKADYLRSLGATPIDRASETVESYVQAYTGGKGFDLVYDTVGGGGLDTAFLAVNRFGHVVSCLGWGTHALAPLSFNEATYSGVFTLNPLLTGEGRAHHGDIMREATRLVEAGEVTPKLDGRRFTFANANVTHDLIENRQANGKLVIDID
jgi:NADPH2:quinone reductase